MGHIWKIPLPALAALLLSAPTSSAQDEYCTQRARDLCGDNQTIGQCFQDQDMWSNLDADCTGAVQTMIETEREALEAPSGSALNLYGTSYGGVLRSGPGQEFSRVASLREGDSIEIIGDPEVWWEGYKWFQVRTSRGVGYHWGGIFCVPGAAPPAGVYSNCQ